MAFSCTHVPRYKGIEIGKDLIPPMVIEKIREDNLSRRSIDARVKLKIMTNGETARVVNQIVAMHPRSLRIETFGEFGILLAVFVSDGQKIVFAREGEKAIYIGEATDDNFKKYFTIDETLFDIVTLLLGGIPFIKYETIELERTRKNLKISFLSKELEQELLLEGHGKLKPVSLKVTDPNGLIIREVEWLDFDRDGFPVKLRLSYPLTNTHLEVRYKKYELNPELGDKTFEYMIPPGTEVIVMGHDR
jgi:hypothetical protein